MRSCLINRIKRILLQIDIIKKFSLKKSQVLYVGDMVIDAQAGRRAKVKTIIVTSGSSGIAEIKREHPFKIISGVRQLEKIVD